jgi:site-specific recombinase XerD
MKEEIYKSERKLKTILSKIKDSDISENNKKSILQFHDECFSQGISSIRVLKCVYTLFRLSKWLNKDFIDVNLEDIKALVGMIEKSDFAEWTKHDYKVILKKFYKWLRGNEDFPTEVKWIKTTMKNNRQKLPEELLTEEEVKKLIESANEPRDRALVSVLYESGCRIGELLSLKIKEIDFDKYGALLSVIGKTGSRRVRIVASSPYLAEWINKHPMKDNPDAPLWIRKDYTNKLLSYERVKVILIHLKKKSGIKKKVNPHNFRHSRATFLANFLTEAQLKEMFGWTQSSDMASIYVHLSGRDVDNALLRTYGIEQDEKNGHESELKPKECIRCKQVNPVTNKFCSMCGMVLNEKTIVEVIEKDLERKKADEVLDELIKDEKFREMFLNKIKEVVNKH